MRLIPVALSLCALVGLSHCRLIAGYGPAPDGSVDASVDSKPVNTDGLTVDLSRDHKLELDGKATTCPIEQCDHNGSCYDVGKTVSSGTTCKVCTVPFPNEPPSDKNPPIVKEGCAHDGLCHREGAKRPGLECEKCTISDAGHEWQQDPTTCIIDGKCFAAVAVCREEIDNKTYCALEGKYHPHPDLQACRICKMESGALEFTTVSTSCFVDDQCYAVGQADASACNICMPSIGTEALQPRELDSLLFCSFEGKCFDVNDPHPTFSSCAKCEALSADRADWRGYWQSNQCYLDGACYVSGALPLNVSATSAQTCGFCAPASPNAWTLTSKDVCIIDGHCYNKGDQVDDSTAISATGCRYCDAEIPFAWSPIPYGGCKVDDRCLADNDEITNASGEVCASCDKNHGDELQFEAGYCVIDGTCYAGGDVYPGLAPCASCDPSVNSKEWTPADSTQCYIDDACHAKGVAAPSLAASVCLSCDASQSKFSWTISSQFCFLDGECQKATTEDVFGCRYCDPESPNGQTRWQIKSLHLLSQTFESELTADWTIVNADKDVGWHLSSRRVFEGAQALYFGDDNTWSMFALDGTTPKASRGTVTTPLISIPAPAPGDPPMKAILTFAVYLDVESDKNRDIFRVRVHSAGLLEPELIWKKNGINPSTLQAIPEWKINVREWKQVTVELSKYAGQNIEIEFDFNTIDAENNTSEGVYLDDITVLGGCVAGSPLPAPSPGP